MEKLQIAMEKARASRLAQKSPASPEAAGAPRRPAVTPPPERDGEDPWGALQEIALTPEVLKRNRVVAHHPGPLTSYYDILRTRLRDEAQRRGIKRLAFTSTRPEAGKSTTLANLAMSFSRMGHYRTMLFDFDLRHPKLAHILGLQPTTDMGKIMRGEVPLEQGLLRYGENVCFGLNHAAVSNSSELLQSVQTQDFLTAVEEIYRPDLMLFDMPPFLSADDTQGFLNNIDGVVLIVESGRTSRHQLDMVEQKLTDLTTVVGVVLNKCPFPDESDAGAYGNYGNNYY